GEFEWLGRNAASFDARQIAVTAAIAAMQCKANGAHATARQDLVIAYLLLEHQPRASGRKRRDNAEFATAGATIGAFAAGALSIAEIDDVVAAAGAGQVERADGIGSKLHLAAAFRFAFVAGALQDLLHAGRICVGIECLDVLRGRAAATHDGGEKGACRASCRSNSLRYGFHVPDHALPFARSQTGTCAWRDGLRARLH